MHFIGKHCTSALRSLFFDEFVEGEYDIEKTEIEVKKQREIDKLKAFQEKLVMIIGIVILLISIFVYLRIRHIRNVNERNQLIHEIELLKEKRISSVISSSISQDKMGLDMEKIEFFIEAKLNESDQKVLNALYQDPVISNKDLADKVALSYEGASSSLQKMYRLFDMKRTKNMKLALIMKATRISDNESSV